MRPGRQPIRYPGVAAPPKPARRPSNQHAALCARKAGKAFACSCGATERSKARENEVARRFAEVGIFEEGPTVPRGPTTYRRQVRFLPGRDFKADFLFDVARLVFEFQGHASGYGAHGGIAKAKADVDKFSLAAAHGWRVSTGTRDTVKSGESVRRVLAALAWRP